MATWSSLLICGGLKTWSKSPYSGTLSDHVSTYCWEKGERLNEWIERERESKNQCKWRMFFGITAFLIHFNWKSFAIVQDSP